MGTYGSRSISVGGAALMRALDKMEAKAKNIAADTKSDKHLPA
jgi:carbon-monoxide dehydrogenase large subunit